MDLAVLGGSESRCPCAESKGISLEHSLGLGLDPHQRYKMADDWSLFCLCVGCMVALGDQIFLETLRAIEQTELRWVNRAGWQGSLAEKVPWKVSAVHLSPTR